ncbi:thiol:disulfide interchange protein precursor [Thalassovita autumnalis]|jgi:cytochrome c-type biogenesis protein|uniref:Thiol:disulfide interchange protein n=2 Tax=Rhodobacterales TaxID=204455 RepID=A0A0P1G997_9RHOB|nr:MULTISPECIES: cytochrome c biogenesis protein CcdA [Rhodobacterales]MBS4011490.1 cytochrome c biogenesis protein CcdA [Roseovarius sp.]RAI52172.1 cytochrome c biogenesis protein CcdA [Rhodobacteraceae bacterium AsT-22]KAA0910163.1 cytochrome c biogenesis protein CcdA [Aquicoccus porphyridii]CUH68995.1 thiol:disulfide interchange protein precursor [Thalassovita autumnalis]CUH72282.1 thiol:disulfide interchange protein precursor [Thalassovita autumnalis]
MFEISGVGIVAAFLGGTISFLSPCVLPLAPGYVSYIAGQPAVKSGAARSIAERARSVILSLWFVFGFSTVFVALGVGASLLGGMLLRWKYELGLAGGFLIVLFGLVMMGAIKIPAMMRDTRPDVKVDGGSAVGAYLLGLAFAFGWTPWIGPVLGSILAVSATSGADGMALLAIYSAGLGLPFLIIALFTNEIAGRLKRIGAAGRWLYRISGGLMVLMGIGVMTGQISRLAFWLLETFPALGTIG